MLLRRDRKCAAVAPSRQAAASANAPLDLANPVAPPPPRASTPPMRATASRNVPEPPPGTAPLSLGPDSSPPPSAARSAPARVASAPAGNGSYLVQVSSQRSEADAQAAFRSIKSKYSGVLGESQPVIRRAELAGQGHLLPCHGRPVHHPRSGDPALQQPEVGGWRLRCAVQLSWTGFGLTLNGDAS